MFKFIKTRILKEHMKLVAQNYNALTYLTAFLDEENATNYLAEINSIHSVWQPGQTLVADDVKKMLEMNKVLRRLYDNTPNRLFKSFDNEFQPLLGWDNYFQDYL